MSHSTHRYGPRRAQTGDLWWPPGARDARPVVVLIHGGYWRAVYTRVLMSRLARSVSERGWVAWNVEYRRTGLWGGGGGWPVTLEDVTAAIDWLAGVDGVDLDRVVLCGHSAGGQLAVCAAAGRPPGPGGIGVRAVVSLAGLLDLDTVVDQGNTAATLRFMGGSPKDVPDRYRAASPLNLLPIGLPQVLVHGTHDTTVPAEWSRNYQQRAQEAGEDAVYEPVDGADHLDVISGTGPSWDVLSRHLASWEA